jgi:glucose dehydrogenase
MGRWPHGGQTGSRRISRVARVVLLTEELLVRRVRSQSWVGSKKVISAFTADQLTALPGENWITNGGTLFNQRYSPLDQLIEQIAPKA